MALFAAQSSFAAPLRKAWGHPLIKPPVKLTAVLILILRLPDAARVRGAMTRRPRQYPT